MTALGILSPRRGYVLLEAVIGGAFVAVVLGIVLVQIATARQEVSYQSRHATASALARARGEEIAAAQTLAAQPLSAFVDVDPVNYPGLQIRDEIIASTIGTQSTPTIVVPMFEIRVDVRVPTAGGGFDTITYRTLQKD